MNDNEESHEDEDIDADEMDQLISEADSELANGKLKDSLLSEEEEEEEEEEEQFTSLSTLETVHAKNHELSYEEDEQMVDDDEDEEEDDEDQDDQCNGSDDRGVKRKFDEDDAGQEDEEEATETEDFDKTDAEDNVFHNDSVEDGSGDTKRRASKQLTDNDQSPIEKASPIRNRRPSRNCRPNSLIFNADTTASLSPVPRKKRGRPSKNKFPRNNDGTPLTSTPAGKNVTKSIKSHLKTTARKGNGLSKSQQNHSVEPVAPPSSTVTSSSRPVRLASRRTSYQDMVKKAVMSSNKLANAKTNPALYTLHGTLKKKMGRPRKYPVPESAQAKPMSTKSPLKTKKLTPNSSKVHAPGHKKGASPPVKLSPFLAAILSGQSLGETKNGRPKGRPRVLPTLDEAVLNGSTSTPGIDNLSSERRSLRKCDCEAKYRKILVNLEESLESKFAESTYKVINYLIVMFH